MDGHGDDGEEEDYADDDNDDDDDAGGDAGHASKPTPQRSCQLEALTQVLGYKAVIRDFRPLSVLDATLPLSGCLDLDCNRTRAH